MIDDQSAETLLKLTADIVSAYVSNNSVSVASVQNVIAEVHGSLAGLSQSAVTRVDTTVLRPAVPVKRSIHGDFIVCLEDGKRFKSLKRYLRTQYSLTPEQYRAKWRLPTDYPMVAPNYARTRSDLAKSMKLGHKSVRASGR